jgi:hypothetical protein
VAESVLDWFRFDGSRVTRDGNLYVSQRLGTAYRAPSSPNLAISDFVTRIPTVTE